MQTIKLDISAKNNVQKVYAKQRDVGSKFIVEFFENGVPYEIDDEAIWSVWYSGASGDGNYIAIGDHVAVIAHRDTATVEMIMQMLDKPGDHEMCLVMYDEEGGQKGYWNIPYYVEAVPGADSKGATEYYQAFLEAQEKAEEAAERAEEAAERAEASGGGGSGYSVLYTPQTLNKDEKAQARENIGAMDEESVLALIQANLPPNGDEVSY